MLGEHEFPELLDATAEYERWTTRSEVRPPAYDNLDEWEPKVIKLLESSAIRAGVVDVIIDREIGYDHATYTATGKLYNGVRDQLAAKDRVIEQLNTRLILNEQD